MASKLCSYSFALIKSSCLTSLYLHFSEWELCLSRQMYPTLVQTAGRKIYFVGTTVLKKGESPSYVHLKLNQARIKSIENCKVLFLEIYILGSVQLVPIARKYIIIDYNFPTERTFLIQMRIHTFCMTCSA